MITETSQKKDFALSTLNRKYKNTMLPSETIEQLHSILTACAFFYQVIEMDEVWKIVKKFSPALVTRDMFDSIVSIDARNGDLDYYIYAEDYFYNDGEPCIFYLIDRTITEVLDPLYTEEDAVALNKFIIQGGNPEEYDGRLPIVSSLDVVYQLFKLKAGKTGYYIPKDLLEYEDICYYEHNAQTEAMRDFLKTQLHYSDDEAESKMGQFMALIKDMSLSSAPANIVEPVMQLMEDDLSASQMQPFLNLFMDMHNHTCHASNNGYSPDAFSKKFPPVGGPGRITFGPGIREGFASGDIDPDALKNEIINDVTIAPELKAMFLKAIAEVNPEKLQPTKIGRNDPCPCGSGKKYKHCCGK